MELEADGCRATILPAQGGRMALLEVAGWQLLVPAGPDVFHWGNFAMAPWAGRLRRGILRFHDSEHHFPLNAPPHALHGLVTDRAWREDGPGVLSIDLAEPWPWRGRVTHSMQLGPDRLDFRLELAADEPMPAALGWHPWFGTWITDLHGNRAGPIVLDARPRLMYANDADGLPSGDLVPPAPRPWDYCFTEFAAPPVVRCQGVRELTVESSCSDWVIYEGEPQGLCVEPWTAPPNALNLATPPMVAPGSPLVATMAWRWRRLA